ncbi:GMC oxidoreductase [Actinomycetospora sp. NBRC 106378]|uniref:GMC family oxidoreductase n=1 Tax=Actinomycetospora sp. NBRC 106378 TaxID=3032208 RepID=UPI0024A35329|nr:GMC oxidoreductase [Actinomycetospora sp. NBRC 106378]GLZ51900.1 GMC oxidoreductase [Actinomycetospora sp. NBRC 106378]
MSAGTAHAAVHDYVVVGGGAAGCIVAARLSEDPGVSVLCLESGAERRNPLLAVPAAEVLWMGSPRYDWSFDTASDPTIGGRSVRIPRGRLLGGSNAINGMLYVRGQRADYDDWAAAGNPGWGWTDVLPHFRALEDSELPGPTRGVGGPVPVGLPGGPDELCDAFLAAAGSLGHGHNPDYNAGDQEGIGYYQATSRAGRRSAVVHTHLAAARRRRNLTVVTDAHVVAVDWSGTRATGVRYRRGGRLHGARAAREVVLCAGAVQTPHLLELSGVGAPEVLRAAGIPTRHRLDGVGADYRDHYAVRLRWRVRRRVTFNDRTRGTRLLGETVRYLRDGSGVLGLPTALAYAFLRSDTASDRPDLQFHFAPASYGAGPSRRFDDRPGMTLGVYPLRPRSSGSIHASSPDPAEPPRIEPAFLSDEDDLRLLVAGARLARRIVGRPALDAYRGEELTPGPASTSDEDLADYARECGDTSYHPVGTCRMGRDPGAVVDHRLRVHGLTGLRIVDASVMPSMVSGNSNAATLMIAEKGASMIVEDRVPVAPPTAGVGG